jgi:hypothetical protein
MSYCKGDNAIVQIRDKGSCHTVQYDFFPGWSRKYPPEHCSAYSYSSLFSFEFRPTSAARRLTEGQPVKTRLRPSKQESFNLKVRWSQTNSNSHRRVRTAPRAVHLCMSCLGAHVYSPRGPTFSSELSPSPSFFVYTSYPFQIMNLTCSCRTTVRLRRVLAPRCSCLSLAQSFSSVPPRHRLSHTSSL